MLMRSPASAARMKWRVSRTRAKGFSKEPPFQRSTTKAEEAPMPMETRPGKARASVEADMASRPGVRVKTGSTALPTRNSRVAEASRASTVMDSLAAVSPVQADSKPAASSRRPKSPASGSAKPASGSSIPQRMARG